MNAPLRARSPLRKRENLPSNVLSRLSRAGWSPKTRTLCVATCLHIVDTMIYVIGGKIFKSLLGKILHSVTLIRHCITEHIHVTIAVPLEEVWTCTGIITVNVCIDPVSNTVVHLRRVLVNIWCMPLHTILYAIQRHAMRFYITWYESEVYFSPEHNKRVVANHVHFRNLAAHALHREPFNAQPVGYHQTTTWCFFFFVFFVFWKSFYILFLTLAAKSAPRVLYTTIKISIWDDIWHC